MPDPEVDFKGCLDALVNNARAEIEGMTPEQQGQHFLMCSIEHAIRMHELDAP